MAFRAPHSVRARIDWLSSSADEASVVDTCTKTGVKCHIEGGQFGVCMVNPDGTFACAPQH